MTLIASFHAPQDEVSDRGLKEITMNRLGRFVALTGRNGAGKSRVLDKLEFYVNARLSTLENYDRNKQNILGLRESIKNDPRSVYRSSWEDSLKSAESQMAYVDDRIVSLAHLRKFKSVRFVPKQLGLVDPSDFPKRDLLARSSGARSTGVSNFEQNCLFYVQQLQDRWWNASHQNFDGGHSERSEAIAEYERIQHVSAQLLGDEFQRSVDGELTLFGRPIAKAGLSDGQKVILQLCIALHAQHADLDNSVFLLDEPENHLHPSAVIDLLKSLSDIAPECQIWTATHSIPLLAYIASVDPMSLWYVDQGSVAHAGRNPKVVLEGLLGDEERIGQLQSFVGLPAQLAAINYAVESLLPPAVVARGEKDPQVSQIQKVLESLGRSPIAILDYGAGKGRLLDGLAADATSKGNDLTRIIDYFAFDMFDQERQACIETIQSMYTGVSGRYFNSKEEFLSKKDEGSIDCVVMCNVLHEISPRDWLDIFSSSSLILRSLKDDGYLLIVEDQRIPVGELAHDFGFLVLDTSHLRKLFSIREEDDKSNRFVMDDSRGDGRLKAHLISKSLLTRITGESRSAAISDLRETAKDQIRRLRALRQPTYQNGQLNGFWTQQFANAELYLAEC